MKRGKCLSSSSGRGAQRKLDDLIDRGVIRSSDLDNRTMDALEGAYSSSLPPFLFSGPCIAIIVSPGCIRTARGVICNPEHTAAALHHCSLPPHTNGDKYSSRLTLP